MLAALFNRPDYPAIIARLETEKAAALERAVAAETQRDYVLNRLDAEGATPGWVKNSPFPFRSMFVGNPEGGRNEIEE